MIDEKELIARIRKEIDREHAKDTYTNGRNAGLQKAVMIVQAQHKKNDGWIPCSERMPENEQEVEITYIRSHPQTGKDLYLTARAFHEDGTMMDEDSCYTWCDMDNLEYDEENDCSIVGEGWFESVSFAEEFAKIVDETVIAWRPVGEPYKPEKAGNKT